jgi:hypothetical protein
MPHRRYRRGPLVNRRPFCQVVPGLLPVVPPVELVEGGILVLAAYAVFVVVAVGAAAEVDWVGVREDEKA